jgi:hypothetical protein
MVTSCNTLHLDYLSHRIGALVLASPWDTGFHRQNQSILARSMPCSSPACPHAGEPEKGVTITHILFAGRKAAALAWRAATTTCHAREIFRSATKTGRHHEKTPW